MFGHKEPLNREFILSRISEEDIFLKYLNIYPNLTDWFRNPLRTDDKPDCKFYRDSRGVLKFHDFAYKLNIDCFNLVQLVEPNVNNYGQALEKIAEDFKLYEKDIDYSVVQNWQEIIKKAAKSLSSIRIKRKDFTKDELKWWAEQGIHKETLDLYKIFSLQLLWLNNSIVYTYRKQDPGFVQHFKGYEYKAYFPFRERYRFLQNIDSRTLQGYDQLPDQGDFLIITKSNKDVMALYEFGIPAVAPLSESVLISEEIFEELSNRFFKIFTLFDRDRAGMWLSQQMRKKYNTIPLLFESETIFRDKKEPKDFTDHYKSFGLQYCLDLIQECKEIYL